MSVLSELQGAIGFPAHLDMNGETIERRPKGEAAITGLRGVWTEYSEDQFSSQRPTREFDAAGNRVTRYGLLQVPESQDVLDTDAWLVLGEEWQVQRVGAVVSGYRELYLQRDDKKRTAKYSQHRM